ncbi:MAG: hypothetical protein AUI14_07940 [Actinobacteria bacterium 13_2_20CM_2_71_6]|nr:MAG: hypothetical protein AUI14_07940 [Actinobacteria bacterium 13_2_20CM_2_71_6]
MRLIWDCVGSEFGGRHELYELNYSGPHENNLLDTLRWQQNSGAAAGYERAGPVCRRGAPGLRHPGPDPARWTSGLDCPMARPARRTP